MLLDTVQRSVQASAACAASCPAPGKAFRADDADALARVICSRRSVFPKHFSGAPIDRLVPLNAAQPRPLSPALAISPARKWLEQRRDCSFLNEHVGNG